MNCLRPLEFWDCGFQSHSRHRCLCVHLFCVVLCVGRAPAKGLIPHSKVLPTVYSIMKLEKAAKAQQKAL
jgi:hypothetical protein